MADERDLFELARTAVAAEHAAQDPKELAALAAYLTTHTLARPDGRAPNPLRRIVEIGSFQGGTLWFWRRLAPDALIVAIDIGVHCDGCSARRAHSDCPRDRIRQNADVFIEQDSRNANTIGIVADKVGLREIALHGWAGLFPEDAGIDLLFIDGNHSFDAVEADFQNYAPMLSPQGIVVLHDVAGPAATLPNDGNPSYGVVEFWTNIRRLVPQSFEISERPGVGYGLGVVPKPE